MGRHIPASSFPLPPHSSSGAIFDPNLPLENTVIDAAEMRGELNGLKALIDARIPGRP